MFKISKYLDSINQQKLLNRKLDAKIALLAGKAELIERANENWVINKDQLEEFRCSFCLCFVLDPVMCPKCKHVFCLKC